MSTGSTMRKIPPHNIEAEQSVLGSMMIEASALDKGLELLTSADFYRPTNQDLFTVLSDLADRNEPADLITLTEELRGRNKLEDCGGVEYLQALLDAVPTAANIEHYAKIVRQKSMLRHLISANNEIYSMAYDESLQAEDVLEKAEHLIFKACEQSCVSEVRMLEDVLRDAWDELPRMGKNGIPIFLDQLRRACVAMFPREFTVIAASSGTGKSALAWQQMMHAAKQGVQGAIFSFEMSDLQFGIREMAQRSGVATYKMLSDQLDQSDYDRIAKGVAPVYKLPIHVIDSAGWNMSQVRTVARRLAAQGVKLIVLDHLQIVTPDNVKASRHLQLSQISGDCKILAKNLGIHVVGLCQLSRDFQKRGESARPLVSDLKESGDIENNADVIWLLWRPQKEIENAPKVGEAEIIIGKNRMLPRGLNVKCGYEGRRFRFCGRDEMHEAQGKAPSQQPALI